FLDGAMKLRLRHLNVISLAALALLSIALLASLIAVLHRVQLTAAEVQRFYALRELAGAELRPRIESYLASGDTEQLAESQRLLEALSRRAAAAPAVDAERVTMQAQQLAAHLSGEVLAAGKLAGSPEALLQQAEAELRGALDTLAGLAFTRLQRDDSAADWLRLTGELSRAVGDLALA